MSGRIAPLRSFVQDLTALVGSTSDEVALLTRGHELLADLVRDDGWLPDEYAIARQDRYAQYLLHCDPLERFSMVSFVWGPGQRTPVHNHTVWGLVGVLRGTEESEAYAVRDGLPVGSGDGQVMTSDQHSRLRRERRRVAPPETRRENRSAGRFRLRLRQRCDTESVGAPGRHPLLSATG